MENKPSFDREMILPILLGVLSAIGIGIIFVLGRLSDARQPAPVADTKTPFRFVYLGTEPGLSTLTPEATATITPAETGPASTPITGASPTENITPPNGQPTRTATASPTIPFVLSKIDDTYFELLYDGDWVNQSNVDGTYQDTLHISFTVGNTVSYTFTGQQVIVSFQSGPSLGRISITLDGLTFEVDQSSGNTQIVDWRSAILLRGTHTVTVSHLSGGSINLDSITIPDVSTPTPTPTNTQTSSQ